MCFIKKVERPKKEANFSINDIKMTDKLNNKIDSSSFSEILDYYLTKTGENEFIQLGIMCEVESNNEHNFQTGFKASDSKFKRNDFLEVKLHKSLTVKEVYERMIRIINYRILENNKINKLEKAKHSKFFIDDMSKIQ